MKHRAPLRQIASNPMGLLLASALFFWATADSALGQWTQWGGPHRDFMVKSEGLADKWPEDGPRKLWHRELGDGYATIVVDDGTLYTMYRTEEDEFTVALDANTGKTVWEHRNPSPATELMNQFGPGPHSTPLVAGNRLYTIGTNAVMHCFDKKSGEVLWKHDLPKEFGAPVPGRGYGCSPIAYKDTIIVPVDRERARPEGEGEAAEGNEEGAAEKAEEKKAEPVEGQTLMAFDQATGKVVWKKHDYPASYASPILIDFKGEEQLVQLLQNDIIGVSPADGELLWHLALTPQGANLATPLWTGGDLLFCSSAYDSGSRVVKLSQKDDKTVAEQLWYSRKMRVHHGNAVQFGDVVYGSSGDFGPAFFMGVDLRTGDPVWRERGFKKATCVKSDDKLIILDEDGQLALASVNAEGMKVHSTCTVGERYAWAAPTLVGKTLYVRDRKHIMALDLG